MILPSFLSPLDRFGVQEMCRAADLSLPQLELLVRHLVALGHAKVMHAINTHAVYAVRSPPPTSPKWDLFMEASEMCRNNLLYLMNRSDPPVCAG